MKQTLPNRSVISVSGPDAKAFLQGLITNDINKADNNLIYAFLLSPQGRFLADLFIIKDNDRYLLDVPQGSKDVILQKFKMYQLRSKVTVEDLSHNMFVTVTADETSDFYSDPRNKLLPFRGFTGTREENSAAFQEYEIQRIRLLIPDAELDFIYDRSFPLEFGGENLNAIDYQKGCYVGQEVTARTHYKGTIRKCLFTVSADKQLPPKMSEVNAGDNKIGIMLGSINKAELHLGLALINTEDLSLHPSGYISADGCNIVIHRDQEQNA